MSSIPSSKGTALLVTLLIAAAAVGTAVAVSTSTVDAPDEAPAGEQITVEVTIVDLYEENSDWTLQGTTELENITSWDVTKTWSNESTRSDSFEGQDEFNVTVTEDRNFESITVTVSGEAPTPQEFSYDPAQKFDGMKLTQVIGEGGESIENVRIHYYTNQSREARQAIDDARDAINGTDNADARDDLNSAIEEYEEGDFGNAIDDADSAEQTANQAQQSEETMQLVLYAVGAIVLLALIGGGVYYYRNQQDSYDKLR